MGKEDKGLLEDLLGDSMDAGGEQTTKTMEIPIKKTAKKKLSLEEQIAGDGDLDDPLMSELVQRKSSGGNKRLIVLSVVFLVIGLIGAGFKFGFIPYAQFARPKIKLVKKPASSMVSKPKNTDQAATNPSAPLVAPAQTENQLLPVAKAPTLPEPVVTNPNVADPAVANQVNVVDAPKAESVVEKVKEPESKPIVDEQPKKQEVKTVAVEKPRFQEHAQEELNPSFPEMSEEQGAFSIQIGSYLFASSLQQPVQKLKKMGFQPKITKGKHKVSMHRVLVGNFRTQEVAMGALKDLAEEGIQGHITKKKNGYFSVLTGSFVQQNQAEKLSKRLEEFGYDVMTDRAPVTKAMQELKVGS